MNSLDEELLMASYHGHHKKIIALIEQGACVNSKMTKYYDETCYGGCSPLMVAVSRGHLKTAKILIEHQAEVDYKNILFSDEHFAIHVTPLMRAAYFGQTKCIKLLCESGSNVNLVDSYGNTAIFHLFQNCENTLHIEKKETINILISHGLNVNHQNLLGSTVLIDQFLHHISKKIIEVILSSSEKNENTMEIPANNWYSQLTKDDIQIMISCGVNIDIKDKSGKTAMDYINTLLNKICDNELYNTSSNRLKSIHQAMLLSIS